MATRDNYSNFGWYQAIAPAVYDAAKMPVAGVVTGPDIDTQGFQALTFIINTGDVDVSGGTGAAATSTVYVRMQHTSASALGLGPSTYVDVSSTDVIGSGISDGAALTSGILVNLSISGTSVADYESMVWTFGYKGSLRYVRLVVESAGTVNTGSAYIGAVAVCGYPEHWPVNAPA